jgi:hypothetical protein
MDLPLSQFVMVAGATLAVRFLLQYMRSPQVPTRARRAHVQKKKDRAHDRAVRNIHRQERNNATACSDISVGDTGFLARPNALEREDAIAIREGNQPSVSLDPRAVETRTL